MTYSFVRSNLPKQKPSTTFLGIKSLASRKRMSICSTHLFQCPSVLTVIWRPIYPMASLSLSPSTYLYSGSLVSFLGKECRDERNGKCRENREAREIQLARDNSVSFSSFSDEQEKEEIVFKTRNAQKTLLSIIIRIYTRPTIYPCTYSSLHASLKI